MKKNIINLVLSVFVLLSIVSVSKIASALTIDDISMLYNAGIISQAQAIILNNGLNAAAVTPTANNTAQNNPTKITQTDCADIVFDIKLTQRDTVANSYAVSILQAFLKNNGYLQSSPTGYFGSMTLSAVKAFQTAYGINATGFVGPATREKIKNLDCNYGNTTVTVVSNAPVANKIDSIAPTVTLSANPAQVIIGGPTTLGWSSSNASGDCKITAKDSAGNSFSSAIESSSSKSTGSINKTTTYTIICYNKYGIPGSKSLIVKAVSSTTAATTDQQKYAQAAVVTSVTPSSANRGDVVKITGSNFLSTNEVVFDGAKVDSSLVVTQSSTSISFKIPEYKSCLSSYCPPPTVNTNVETGGKKIIQVSNVNGYSNDFAFILPSKIITIIGVPDVIQSSAKLGITSINPTSGNRGDTVTISGTGFSSDSIVLFGGFKVADNLVQSKSTGSIIFTVPPFQMGCTDPDVEVCPRLPLPGTGLVIETGGVKSVYIMNTLNKATSTGLIFTLPSKKITY